MKQQLQVILYTTASVLNINKKSTLIVRGLLILMDPLRLRTLTIDLPSIVRRRVNRPAAGAGSGIGEE